MKNADFMTVYEQWLRSDALTGEERAELLAIRDDPKEIESRFYDAMSFGTALIVQRSVTASSLGDAVSSGAAGAALSTR